VNRLNTIHVNSSLFAQVYYKPCCLINANTWPLNISRAKITHFQVPSQALLTNRPPKTSQKCRIRSIRTKVLSRTNLSLNNNNNNNNNKRHQLNNNSNNLRLKQRSLVLPSTIASVANGRNVARNAPQPKLFSSTSVRNMSVARVQTTSTSPVDGTLVEQLR